MALILCSPDPVQPVGLLRLGKLRVSQEVSVLCMGMRQSPLTEACSLAYCVH